MFTARTVFVESGSVETGTYDLVPSGEQPQRLCNLFLDYLVNRPPQFRDKLEFLTKGSYELDWSAAPGGAASASLYDDGEPISMSVLLSGAHPEADDQMVNALRKTVLDVAVPTQSSDIAAGSERPLLLNVIFPGAQDKTPTVQLLLTALASVYFRAILQIHREQTMQ